MMSRLSLMALVLGLAMVPQAARAQGRPYSLEQVVELISAGVPTARVLDLVRGDCLAFRLEAATEARLREAGADAELITGLRGVCSVAAPVQSRGPATRPTTAARAVSPASAAVRSLLVPGLGQFSTGRPVRGALFLGAAGGALAFGALSQSETVYCASRSAECPPEDVIDTESRSRMGLGLAGFAAVAVAAALEAFLNAGSDAAPLAAHAAPGWLKRSPTVAPTRDGVRVELYRIQF